MKAHPHIKGTKRDFIRQKRRQIKVAKKACEELYFGCAMRTMFDGTLDFYDAVCRIESAFREMDRITKPLR